MLYHINLDQPSILVRFRLDLLVSGSRKLCRDSTQCILTFPELKARRHWEKPNLVSFYGRRNTSSFQTRRQGHRLLRLEIHHRIVHPPPPTIGTPPRVHRPRPPVSRLLRPLVVFQSGSCSRRRPLSRNVQKKPRKSRLLRS